MRRFQVIFLFDIVLLATAIHPLSAQVTYPDQLVNGGMEDSAADRPTGWTLVSPVQGSSFELSSENPFEGSQCVLVDTLTTAETAERMKANISQTINGVPWRGKRVRLRASVLGANLASNAKAQLWFRVDKKRENGRPAFGAFDNMMDRPIKDTEWTQHDVVLQVDEDAEKMVLGMFVIGRGKFWLDDVSLEEVDADTPTTGRALGSSPARSTGESEKQSKEKKKSKQAVSTSRFQMSPVMQKAWAEAENAPQQPFFSHWMWLALVAIILFGLTAYPSHKSEYINRQGQMIRKPVLGFAPKFAIRFSVAYWLLYSLPTPFNRLTIHLGSDVSVWSQKIYTWYSQQANAAVNWVAQTVFKINGELVPPNGSGDTTFNYIQVFTYFILALLIAMAWSAVDWRRTDYRCVKDLLRSYLRFVLAVTMLSYGLAKLGWDSNQFPTLTSFRLDRTWGETSPMGVLWSFMGASRPYTIFAGLGEVVGGILLLFRVTTLLGSFVVLGVMINVMMLNYCYDVPVKLYSTHLVCMSLFLMLPDVSRIAGLFFFNRPTVARDLTPPYTNNKTIWVQRAFKVALIVFLFGFPVYQHIKRQVDYFAEQANNPTYLGTYDVVETKLDGKPVEDSTQSVTIWKTVKFERLAYNRQMQRERSNWIRIGIAQGSIATTFEESENGIQLDDHQSQSVPTGNVNRTELDENTLVLEGDIPAGRLSVKLVRQSENKYRLTSRGYRWINEVPFNR